ncbi:sugar transferase [Manganibacter manganicus]|uniref:sugar transferase n=1 Tax=Manganibacter manganicus TaxID=1873176 RepID=UPI00178C93D6|nr:sugar transferase [Pseudaminobacter manganicus]
MHSEVKRLFDIIAATFGLIAATPILAICAIVIRLDSHGPAIFRQVRIGRHGRHFVCLKLRTMYQETGDRPSHEVGQSSVTRVGRLLRRTKLDELPQLLNVLKGDMSFVGPRPCLPSQKELTEARNRLGLARLRPGITGIAQVASIDMSDPELLAKYDATYLQVMSMKTDLSLIIRTVFGSGQGDRVSI